MSTTHSTTFIHDCKQIVLANVHLPVIVMQLLGVRDHQQRPAIAIYVPSPLLPDPNLTVCDGDIFVNTLGRIHKNEQLLT